MSYDVSPAWGVLTRPWDYLQVAIRPHIVEHRQTSHDPPKPICYPGELSGPNDCLVIEAENLLTILEGIGDISIAGPS